MEAGGGPADGLVVAEFPAGSRAPEAGPSDAEPPGAHAGRTTSAGDTSAGAASAGSVPGGASPLGAAAGSPPVPRPRAIAPDVLPVAGPALPAYRSASLRPRHLAAHRRRRAVVAFTLVVLLAGPAAFTGARIAVLALGQATGVLAREDRPAALPADASSAPLGRAEPAPEGAGGYRFLGLEDDGTLRPVRWDPCRPIHYVVRPDGAPPGGEAAVRAAVSRMQRLTGLRFVRDGVTDEAPREDRPTMDVARYGNRWSPVLVAWTDPQEYPNMSGYAGLGGPDAVSGDEPGTRRYVTGVVLLNRDHLAEVRNWPDGPDRVEAVVLHEFGHLVGLDHVDDASQLMFRRPTALPEVVGDGDRRGLARLGDGPCFRDF
jgi:hypothetical protein